MTAPASPAPPAPPAAPAAPPGRRLRDALPRALGTALVQFVFIGAGVFMGMQADAWREAQQRREATRATLENLAAELRKNRAAVARVLPYHRALRDSVNAVVPRGPRTFDAFFGGIRFQGTRSVEFARSAWQLALATQALAHVEPRLAFQVADVYQQQETLSRIQGEFSASAFTPATIGLASPMPLAVTMQAYLGDVMYQEPLLVEMYDATLPKIDAALARLPR